MGFMDLDIHPMKMNISIFDLLELLMTYNGLEDLILIVSTESFIFLNILIVFSLHIKLCDKVFVLVVIVGHRIRYSGSHPSSALPAPLCLILLLN